MVLVGMVVACFALYAKSCIKDYLECRATVGWPATHGVVDSLAIPETGSRWVSPVLSYRYSVGGQILTGSRLNPTESSLDPDQAKWLSEHLAARDSVEVRYDPENPSRSTLLYGAGADDILQPMVALFALVFVSAIGFGAYGMNRRDTSEAIADALVRHRIGKATP